MDTKAFFSPYRKQGNCHVIAVQRQQCDFWCMCMSLPQSFIADNFTAIVNPPCRAKQLPFFHLYTGPGADIWVQNSPRAERSRWGWGDGRGVGRTVDVTIYLKQNSFVFECICSEIELRPECIGFTFCATDTIANYAVSALQALPACTLVHLIILKRD